MLMGETNEDIRGGMGPAKKKPKQEKKKILLRLDPALHEQLRLWAERDFRSLNSQIEFILKKSLKGKEDLDYARKAGIHFEMVWLQWLENNVGEDPYLYPNHLQSSVPIRPSFAHYRLRICDRLRTRWIASNSNDCCLVPSFPSRD
jgi:hypothetical protein